MSKIEFGLKNIQKKNVIVRKLHDSDEEPEHQLQDHIETVNRNLSKEQIGRSLQIQEAASQALLEDVNVYKYDEMYDDIVKGRGLMPKDNKEDDKPKYLQSIIAASEKRKLEQSINKEKLESIKRKREEGGLALEDKPKFITRGYEEKLALNKKKELAMLLEEERDKSRTIHNEEYGMMGFYSNLLTKNKLFSNTVEDDKTPNDSGRNNLKSLDKEEDLTISNVNKGDDDVMKVYTKVKKEFDKNLLDKEEKIKSSVVKPNIVEGIKKDGGKDKAEEYKQRYLERKRNRETVVNNKDKEQKELI